MHSVAPLKTRSSSFQIRAYCSPTLWHQDFHFCKLLCLARNRNVSSLFRQPLFSVFGGNVEKGFSFRVDDPHLFVLGSSFRWSKLFCDISNDHYIEQEIKRILRQNSRFWSLLSSEIDRQAKEFPDFFSRPCIQLKPVFLQPLKKFPPILLTF